MHGIHADFLRPRVRPCGRHFHGLAEVLVADIFGCACSARCAAAPRGALHVREPSVLAAARQGGESPAGVRSHTLLQHGQAQALRLVSEGCERGQEGWAGGAGHTALVRRSPRRHAAEPLRASLVFHNGSQRFHDLDDRAGPHARRGKAQRRTLHDCRQVHRRDRVPHRRVHVAGRPRARHPPWRLRRGGGCGRVRSDELCARSLGAAADRRGRPVVLPLRRRVGLALRDDGVGLRRVLQGHGGQPLHDVLADRRRLGALGDRQAPRNEPGRRAGRVDGGVGGRGVAVLLRPVPGAAVGRQSPGDVAGNDRGQ
mmetsp:Transcript_85258/g.260648  ORF Transcript_85258/g.260648 Transcript_85258/m.260648 type:complete len:313 (-) Transcript_85258:32-970(-)